MEETKAKNGGQARHPVDTCFEIPDERLHFELPTYWNYEQDSERDGALYTFEEFIQNNYSSSNSTQRQKEDNENKGKVGNAGEPLANFTASLTEEMLGLGGEVITARIDEKQQHDQPKMGLDDLGWRRNVFDDKFYNISLENETIKAQQQRQITDNRTNDSNNIKYSNQCASNTFNENNNNDLLQQESSDGASKTLHHLLSATLNDHNNEDEISSSTSVCDNNGSGHEPSARSIATVDAELMKPSCSSLNTEHIKYKWKNSKHDIEIDTKDYCKPVAIDSAENGNNCNSQQILSVNTVAGTLNSNLPNTCMNSTVNNNNCCITDDNEYNGIARFFISNLLCCFRTTINMVTRRNQRRYVINNANHHNPQISTNNEINELCNKTITNTNHATQSTSTKQYSWDIERNANPNNIDAYNFSNRTGATLLKASDEINGQQFCIENCIDCVIVLLDSIATVTIDDCRNCLIVIGPCKSSVFVRDSSNCAIYAICQQFRARDCRHLLVRLFCTTQPTIEDSEIEFGPLTICYNKIEEHMFQAGLSPLTNNWSRVHNFTPDSAEFTFVDIGDVNSDSDGLIEFPLNNALHEEFLRSHKNFCYLTFSPFKSFFFTVERDKMLRPYEESVLILCKAFDKRTTICSTEELYHDIRRFLKRLLNDAAIIGRMSQQQQQDPPLTTSYNNLSTKAIRLIGFYDFKCRPGELEAVLQQKWNRKSPGGKMVAIEMYGLSNWLRRFCADTLTAIGNPPSIEIIDAQQTNSYAKQLSRYCDLVNCT